MLRRLLEQAGTAAVKGSTRLADLLRSPQLHYDDIAPVDPDRPALSPAVRGASGNSVEIRRYLARQKRQVEEFRREETRPFAPGSGLPHPKRSAAGGPAKLSEIRPVSIGQAGANFRRQSGGHYRLTDLFEQHPQE